MQRVEFDPFISYNAELQGEVNTGPILVESEGYVDANVLIENMIFAGQRLDIARAEMYDFPDEESIDPNFLDVTRRPGVDPVDIDNAARALNGRIAEQRLIFEKEQKDREEAEKKKAEKAE